MLAPLDPSAAPRRPGHAQRALLAAVAALVLLRAAYWLLAPPNSDEAYYWLWGLHPSLSYFDHPPLHAWIQGLLHAALGRSLLVLRLPAALTTVGTLLVLARLAGRLAGDGRPRLAAVAAALLGSPLLLMLTSFAWHDHLLVLFVVLSGSLLVDFLAEVAAGDRGRSWLLFLGAAALGLAALAKYSAVFLAAGVALTIVSDRRLRRLLRDPRLYAAAALCLAILSPVLVWNLDHGLASFRFHLIDRLGAGGGAGLRLRPLGPVHFLAPTVLLLSPALAWAMRAGVRRDATCGTVHADVHRRVAVAVFATSTAFFLGLSLFAWTLYYWNVVAYLLLVPAAALALSRRPRLMAAHLGAGVAVAAAMVFHATAVPLTALVPAIQDDDSKEPLGWTEIARAVEAERRRAPAGFVAASDYRSGAHLAYALPDPELVVLSGRPSQFDYWLGGARRAGQTALLLTDPRAPLTEALASRFDRVSHVATIPVVRLGVRLKEYELWRAEGFHPPAAR